MRMSKQHFLRLIVIAFAALATTVPAAQAAGGPLAPDDRAGAHGVAATVSPKILAPDDRAGARGVYHDVAATVSPKILAPDDRAGARGVYHDVSATVTPKILAPDDRAGARGVLGIEPRTIPAAVAVSPNGFDWGDAVIGGVLSLALTLLSAGVVLIAVRHHRGALETA
jgi:hypothetical protein